MDIITNTEHTSPTINIRKSGTQTIYLAIDIGRSTAIVKKSSTQIQERILILDVVPEWQRPRRTGNDEYRITGA